MQTALAAGKSVVLDNTSPDVATRATYIALAKQHGMDDGAGMGPSAAAPHPRLAVHRAWHALRRAGSGVPARIFHMTTSRELATHLNYFRMKTTGLRRIPDVAYNMYKAKFAQPSEAEGGRALRARTIRRGNRPNGPWPISQRRGWHARHGVCPNRPGVIEVKAINWVPSFATEAIKNQFFQFT